MFELVTGTIAELCVELHKTNDAPENIVYFV